jgi:hypothetical protein
MWMLAARLSTAAPIRKMARKENVTFAIAASRRDMLQAAGFAGPLEVSTEPTHHMKLTFRPVPEGGASTHYYLECRITRIRRHQHVWADSFRIQRDVVTAQ